MNIIRTIDLWTEQNPNHIECFSGAFVDGFENENIPFDSYKIIRNCNCVISSNQSNLNISNKHNAIIFYNDNVPVRLIVINKETDIDKCINESLNQPFNNTTLRDVYALLSVKSTDINLNEQAIYNCSDKSKEIDVGSCDRPSLLECMLEGIYTQSDTDYGKSNSNNSYSFIPNIFIEYKLVTDAECFKIEHHCAFINENMTRIIPLQDNSSLDIEMISSEFNKNNTQTKKK